MNWVKITDRVPTEEECEKDYGWFLIARKNQTRPDVSQYDGHEINYTYYHGWKHAWDDGITHWMPLPDLPKD